MSDSRRDLAFRLVICIPLVAAAGYVIARSDTPSEPLLSIGLPCLIASALILMPSATAVAGERLKALLYPENCGGKYVADMAVAEMKIDQGDLEAAHNQLMKTALAFSWERAVWMRLFYLTITRMNRPDLAAVALQTARRAGLTPDEMKMAVGAYEFFAAELADGNVPVKESPNVLVSSLASHELCANRKGAYCAFITPRADRPQEPANPVSKIEVPYRQGAEPKPLEGCDPPPGPVLQGSETQRPVGVDVGRGPGNDRRRRP